MDTEQCESLLLDRVRLLHPWNPDGIVAYIASCKTPAEIGQLLTSDDKIAPLIVEAARQFPQLSPLHPPKEWQGLRPFPCPHPQFRLVNSFQGIQASFHWSHSWPQSHPSCIPYVFQAPFPLPHSQPQFCSSRISHEFQAPLPLNVQMGPLHFGLPQLHPSGCSHGIHNAPFTTIGPPGAFQSPSTEFTGSGEHMLEKEIRNLMFLLHPPSLPIESLANMYIDRYGKPLRIEGFYAEGQQYGKAGCSLTDLLMQLNGTRVIERQEQKYIIPVEDAPVYLAHGFKLWMPPASSDPHQIFVVFMPGSKFTEEDVHNYFSQYGTVNNVRIPPQGIRKYGFVSFQDPGTPKHILSVRTPHVICGDQVRVAEYKEKHELQRGQHHGLKLVMPFARNAPNKIFITFDPKSKFTKNDAWTSGYGFMQLDIISSSHYGPVNDVRIPLQKKRTFGYVSFKYPETVKQILSEKCLRTSHFICGDHVFVEPYMEKREPEKLTREVAHPIPGPHEIPDVSFTHQHQTGKQLSSNHELFGEKLNEVHDQGTVTESSNSVAPGMDLPPTCYMSVHSVSEPSPSKGGNSAESSHVSNRLDEASADQYRDGPRLPETLDDVY